MALFIFSQASVPVLALTENTLHPSIHPTVRGLTALWEHLTMSPIQHIRDSGRLSLLLLSDGAIDAIKVIGIVGGLLLAAVGFAMNAFATLRSIRSRKLLNYHEITKSHREIWGIALDQPDKFGRVMGGNVDLDASPVTEEERLFVHLLFLHMTAAYHFITESDIMTIQQWQNDFREVLSKPIPRFVWENERGFFNSDFVAVVDIAWLSSRSSDGNRAENDQA
jgi:hypothetical protein